MFLTCKYIICHGSENRFLMLDAVANPDLEACTDFPRIMRSICRKVGGLDGVLLLVRYGGGYAMRMFNTDGSEAEMCGNGIRCVARLVAEKYIKQGDFTLWSGGREYPITRHEAIYKQIPTFGVQIAVSLESEQFIYKDTHGGFIDSPITPLDPDQGFTYLNLGNPHITGAVKDIDIEILKGYGAAIIDHSEIFTKGANVSLFRKSGKNGIYVATYERGVGLTNSCGTAMSASSMAACLMGICQFDEWIVVSNMGGMVRCRCHREHESLTVELVGNATYQEHGTIVMELITGDCNFSEAKIDQSEIDEYQAFKDYISNNIKNIS